MGQGQPVLKEDSEVVKRAILKHPEEREVRSGERASGNV